MTKAESQIRQLREELAEVRRRSLFASNRGDYMMVARLTAKAAQINKAIFDAESRLYGEPEKRSSGKPLP